MFDNLTNGIKITLKVVFDITALIAALFLAFLLKFNFQIPDLYADNFLSLAMPPILIISFFIALMKIYNSIWRYASLMDLTSVGVAITLGATVALLIDFSLIDPHLNIPRSVYITMIFISFVFLGVGRLIYRLLGEQPIIFDSGRKRSLLIGKHESCVSFFKSLSFMLKQKFQIIGYVTTKVRLPDHRVYGYSCLGVVSELPSIIEHYDFEQIIILNDNANSKLPRMVLAEIKDSQISLKIIPTVDEILNGNDIQYQIRDIQIEDILQRKQVDLDLEEVRSIISAKRVMVTGAGGSIGSELARQVLACNPEMIILVDHSEYFLYKIDFELRGKSSAAEISCNLCDVKDIGQMRRVLEKTRPDMILHAAAYKHVPMLETHPYQAILNNVGGTLNMIKLGIEFEVDNFILISTDKAVNSTSVMGKTKRIAELLCLAHNQMVSKTRISLVRFGNVLSSNGSVIPLFMDQIKSGGPVTVTDKEVERYFMSISEASRLVLKAASLSGGGETFVLNMGQPVKIYDLASMLIRLSGKVPNKDIEIKEIGLRPGEKLHEELSYNQDNLNQTVDDRIFVGRPDFVSISVIKECEHLIANAAKLEDIDIQTELLDIINKYSNKRDREQTDKVQSINRSSGLLQA